MEIQALYVSVWLQANYYRHMASIPRAEHEATANILWHIRWPIFGGLSDIEIADADGRTTPMTQTRPLCNQDGSDVDPRALEPLTNPPTKRIWVTFPTDVMEDWDSEEEEQSEPEPLKVTTEKDSGVTLFDFLQQVHNYVHAHPALITREFDDHLDKREIYLSAFELIVTPPGVHGNMFTTDEWAITMTLDEASRCWIQFPEVNTARASETTRPNLFRLEDGMDPEEAVKRLDERLRSQPDYIERQNALFEAWSADSRAATPGA